MSKITVGVLRGGLSSEYDVSLKTGGAVLSHLPRQYRKVDILIDRDGVWHKNGIPMHQKSICRSVDVVFNALHGYYGEDGKIQKELEHFGVPYTGSGVLSSAIGMNKVLAKKVFIRHKLKTPAYAAVRPEKMGQREVSRVFQTIPQPWVVKPAAAGSSVGVAIASSFEELKEGLEQALQHSSSALVEEYIRGKEATCGVLEDFRGEAHYAFPPVEIIPPQRRAFFDYEAKYSGETRELCPSHFNDGIKEEIMRMAIEAHRAIGARHYSRSDFIISSRGVFLLEINTLPGLTPESLLPKACAAVGCSFSQFLEHTIILAMNKK